MKTFSTAVLFSLLVLLLGLCTVQGVIVTSSSQVNGSLSNCSVERMPDIFPSPCSTKNKTLYILGFVPTNNEVLTAETIIPATYAAIDDINAECDLLRDYKLQLDFVNTKCDPSEATWQLIDEVVLHEDDLEQPKITFFGGGCSVATEPVAALSGRFYMIPHISFGASSPSLSHRNLFPRFMRTIPSEVQANTARFALMKLYNWRRVATLHETQTLFSLAVENFNVLYDQIYNDSANAMDNNNQDAEEDHVLRSFTDDPLIPLKQIKEKDIRIIFGYFYEDKAPRVLCQAYQMNLTTVNHLWMWPAWYAEGWWDVDYSDEMHNCSKKEMKEAVRNSFFLDVYLFGMNTSEETDTRSRTAEEFEKKYNCYLSEFQNNPNSSGLYKPDALPHFYRTFSYDAIWTIALGLNETDWELEWMREGDPDFNLTLDDFAYFDENDVSRMISENMQNSSFTGVSGNVEFDMNGTRVGLNAIYQLIDDGKGSLEMVLLAVHDPSAETDDNVGFNREFEYIMKPQFKSGDPPRDRRTPRNKYMASELVIVCCVLTLLAILVGVALLIFNLVTMCKPLIRDSAPLINTVIIIGCIWMLGTCFLLSIDSNNPPTDDMTNLTDDAVASNIVARRNARYKAVCTARLWFLTIGFTLSFGALFAKTWQVYRVYTNPKLQKEPFKLWNFLIIMGIFLAIDIIYLTFWTAKYGFRRELERKVDTENDVDNFHEECYCDNYPYLIGALYVYKGLLVVFGLFLAYESRNVKYYYINDSRFVSIAMYIVVILVGIGAPLSLVLAVHFFTDAAYSLAIIMVVASCLSCMLIIFIPKFVYMARGKETMVRENEREEITVSDGLQLGRTTIDQTELNTVEGEVEQLKQENAKKDLEMQQQESEVIVNEAELGQLKPRNGSDGDSGVQVTVDENEVFSTESPAGTEDSQRGQAVASLDETPSRAEKE